MNLAIHENEILLYLPRFIAPDQDVGLWWCKDAEDVQAIAINAVCKSTLASWDDVGKCKKFIEQFRFIIVAMPNSTERDEIVQELSARFPISILIPQETAFYGTKSAKELKEVGGQRKINELLFGALEIPMQGLIDIADIDCEKRLNAKRILSGIGPLDSSIGGFNTGDLTVWTGKRGEGKSTLLGQIILDAVNQNRKVCVYSGEMPKRQFKLALLQQAAGELFVEERKDDRTGHVFYDVDKLAIKYIDNWWRKCLFLTDIQCDNAHSEDNIIKLFEYANRKYGCDVFVVDNIMTAELKDSVKLGHYQAQSAFTGRLVAFAKGNDVHVHLVAHPRKTDKRIETDDVGGTSDITNRADNVIKIERIKSENYEKYGCSTLLTVLKNREFGELSEIKMNFNEKSRRFYNIYENDDKQYSWEMAMRNDIFGSSHDSGERN